MNTDRTTKALLFAIAVGLWVHVVEDVWRPTSVQAQGVFGSPELMELRGIHADTGQMSVSLESVSRSLISRDVTTTLKRR